MTDQTRWGIDMVQQENKAKAYKEQKVNGKISYLPIDLSVEEIKDGKEI